MRPATKPNPNIENFTKTLKLEKVNSIHIAELGIHPIIKEKILGRKVITLRDDIEFWYLAGYDYIKLQPKIQFDPGKVFIQDHNMDNLQDNNINRNWAEEKRGVITSWEELEKYQFPEKKDIDYSSFEEVKKYLPEGMGVIGQYGDIFTMVWRLMGFEQFCFALYDNPELIEELFEKIGNLVLSMFEYFAQSGVVDVMWYSDDIAYATGLLISPQSLKTYFFPWLKKIGDLAKLYNKPLIYHTDGRLFEVMEDIINSGVNALHPIEPKAMDIVKVKEKYGNKLCLIGNIDVDLLSRSNPDKIRKNVRENIEKVWDNGGYIVGSGNSIPDYVKLENYIALIEEAKNYRLE